MWGSEQEAKRCLAGSGPQPGITHRTIILSEMHNNRELNIGAHKKHEIHHTRDANHAQELRASQGTDLNLWNHEP